MNKAFLKEPDLTGDVNCPRCGARGQSVGAETLRAHVPPSSLSEISETGFFCPSPTCSVAYFDMFQRVVEVDALNGPVYPKDPDAPICACFSFTWEEVEEEAKQGGPPLRIRALLEKSKSSEARCSQLAANGQCCMPEIQRLFMKFRSAR